MSGRRLVIDATQPAPTVMAGGIGDVNTSQYDVQAGRQAGRMTRKPPFIPLTMAQITAPPLTGLTHVSMFSGAGGTCLGFRLAGFQTLWANDIDDHARQCYQFNLASPIDGRDIRQLSPGDILAATTLEPGELDVFEGSPPCTAFSTAGKQAKGWRQTTAHAGHLQRNVEDLFFDWLRILDGLRPRAFMAENVAGLVRGVAKGYFKDILRQMKAIGYRTEARLLDAQWLGVPQQRCRVIFIGIRDDLQRAPQFPPPQPYRYSVRDALPWILDVIQDPQGQFGVQTVSMQPCFTIKTGCSSHVSVKADRIIGQQVVTSGFTRETKTLDAPAPALVSNSTEFGGQFLTASGQRRKFTIAELKRICSFPDDYQMTGSYAQQWARLGNSVPPLMAAAIAESLRETLLHART